MVGLATLMLLVPLLLPDAVRFARFAVAVVAVVMAGKLFDLHCSDISASRLGPRRFFGFLFNPFTMVERCLRAEPGASARESWPRLAFYGAIFAAPYASAALIDWRGMLDRSFVAEHLVKTLLTMVAVYGGCGVAITLWRMLGGSGPTPMFNFFAARTPAQFWRRYNRCVGQFLDRDVFRPLMRRQSATMATMIVFAVSAIVHEYVFGVAIGGAYGYPTAFFLLQGVAVALTMRLRISGWRTAPAIGLTASFMLLSSLLFFASWNRVVPHYSDHAPAWLGEPDTYGDMTELK
jgi:hypothetical protein